MMWNRSIVASALLVAAIAFVGCEKKEETPGAKLDKAIEKTKDAAEKTGEAVKETAEKTGEAVKEGAEKTKDAVNEATK